MRASPHIFVACDLPRGPTRADPAVSPRPGRPTSTPSTRSISVWPTSRARRWSSSSRPPAWSGRLRARPSACAWRRSSSSDGEADNARPSVRNEQIARPQCCGSRLAFRVPDRHSHGPEGPGPRSGPSLCLDPVCGLVALQLLSAFSHRVPRRALRAVVGGMGSLRAASCWCSVLLIWCQLDRFEYRLGNGSSSCVRDRAASTQASLAGSSLCARRIHRSCMRFLFPTGSVGPSRAFRKAAPSYLRTGVDNGRSGRSARRASGLQDPAHDGEQLSQRQRRQRRRGPHTIRPTRAAAEPTRHAHAPGHPSSSWWSSRRVKWEQEVLRESIGNRIMNRRCLD